METEQGGRIIIIPDQSVKTMGMIAATRFNRTLKAESMGEKVHTGGNHSTELRQILTTAFTVTSKLESEESEWLQKQREGLKNYLQSEGIQEHTVKDAFFQGVETHIKRRHRFLKKDGQNTTDLKSEDGLEGMIRGYTVDFFSSLRMSKRRKFPAGRALEIAKKSYVFNPELPDQLRKAYPDLERWIILRALHGGTNPRQFLDGVRERVTKMSSDFPEFNQGIVTYAAVNQSTGASEFLENLRKKLPELCSNHPQLSQHELTVILLKHPKNPEQKIEDINRKAAMLQEMFPQFYPSSVRDIVLKHSDPKGFLIQATRRLEDLRAEFNGAPSQILLYAAIKCPHNAMEFTQETMSLVTRLQKSLPDTSLATIIKLVINKKNQEKKAESEEEFDELSA